MGLTLYRYVGLTVVFILGALVYGFAFVTRRPDRSVRAERLGYGDAPAARGPVIWLHGASNGELTAARTLIDALLDRDPRLSLIITANTRTARQMVQSWEIKRVTARMAPLDFRWALRRFLAAWQPAAMITLENELWPNRLAMVAEHSMPVLVAGARFSAKSARVWRFAPRLMRFMLDRIEHLTPQDPETQTRLVRFGMPEDRIGAVMNLKSGVRLRPVPEAEIAPLRAALPRNRTLLAASTHAGEEVQILQAFIAARQRNPNLHLILAPRHAVRGEEIAGLIRTARLNFTRRNLDQPPAPAAPVYLADTMGEMALWYQLAAVTFVGGSLVEKGGHTPFEPLQFDSVILHGPSTHNFADAYQALDSQRAAIEVDDVPALTAAIVRIFGDEDLRTRMTERAHQALHVAGAGDDGVMTFVRILGQMTGNPALTR